MMQSQQSTQKLRFTPLTHRFQVALGARLGGGNYGQVLLGRQIIQDKQRAIAVKHINYQTYTNYKKSTKRQIAVMQTLKHPNIIEFYGSHDSSDGLFMFLQLCQQDNLQKLIINKLKEQVAVEWFKQLVEGMSYMNKQNTFHRDLKPQNLLISIQGKLKIADFGIARDIKKQEDHSVMNTMMQGTQLYAAPEILLSNNGDYNQKCDVYSAGLILYQMLTSEKLIQMERKKFPGRTVPNILRTKKDQGGWKIDHPAVVGKPYWMNLLANMLVMEPQKRMSFKEVKEYLSGVKPTQQLPMARTQKQEEQRTSEKIRIGIEVVVKCNLFRLNCYLNVVAVLQESKADLIPWLPKIYQILFVYICSAYYCKINDGLINTFNKRNIELNGQDYNVLFEQLVLRDKSIINKWLDEVAFWLNSQKQQIKDYLSRNLHLKVGSILNNPKFAIQKEVVNSVPYFDQIYQKHAENKSTSQISYQKAIQTLVENIFKSNSDIQTMGHQELRVYFTLLLVTRISLFFDQRVFQTVEIPSFPKVKKAPKEVLVTMIKSLKRGSILIFQNK